MGEGWLQLLMASGELETLLIAHVSLMQRLAMGVLGAGQLPRHIAFIMDGNRRFARCSIFVLKCKPPKRRGRGKETIEGHKGGFFVGSLRKPRHARPYRALTLNYLRVLSRRAP